MNLFSGMNWLSWFWLNTCGAGWLKKKKKPSHKKKGACSTSDADSKWAKSHFKVTFSCMLWLAVNWDTTSLHVMTPPA